MRETNLARSAQRWTESIFRERTGAAEEPFPLAVLPGEGIGPEVVGAALAVLHALDRGGDGPRFRVLTGGAIGRDAELLCGRPLSDEVAGLCEDVFARGGAVLAGPGGGRFVYDLRRRFDLFCKLSPLRPMDVLRGAGRLKSVLEGTDVLVVRENVGGEYFGEWRETEDARDGRCGEHAFRYSEREVRRLLEVAAGLARARTGRLTVVVKDGGVPGMSRLWRDVSREAAEAASVELGFADIDLAAYRLIQEPGSFDVVAASNLFGDVLADVGAALLSSRGLSFSGNFSASGAAVYQTNHGSALDLAGQGRANPIGQIASLAMLLRESFGLIREAACIEAAVEEVLRHGFRTFDIAEPGTTIIGTAEMGERVAAAAEGFARGDG